MRGHTLLEVFLAFMLLTLVIFAVVSLYPGSMVSMTRSHELSVGSNLSMQYVEVSRAQSFATLSTSGPFGNTDDDILYDTNVTVTTLADPNLKEMHVVTGWNGTHQQSLDYVTYNLTNPP